MAKEKTPPERERREQVTLRLPPELYDYVHAEASKRNLSTNAYIIMLLNKALGNINLLDES